MIDFEQIYYTYFADVFRYIRRLSNDEHIAEEITADTFFKAMQSIDKFRGDCDIRVWLCQIAKNRYLSYLKKHKHIDMNQLIGDPFFLPSQKTAPLKKGAVFLSVFAQPARLGRADSLSCCQRRRYIQYALIAAAPEIQLQASLLQQKRSVDQNIDQPQKLPLRRCSVEQLLKGIA